MVMRKLLRLSIWIVKKTDIVNILIRVVEKAEALKILIQI
jgi:hypothetical protein